MVGAEQPLVDMRAPPSHLFRHVLVDEVDVLDAVVPASDSGLVADDSDGDPGTVQRCDRVDRPVEELHPIHGTDVPVIGDDRPVAVEKNAGAIHTGSRVLTSAVASHLTSPAI